MAASVLGAAEIAYHAQSLPLYPLLGVVRPVLIPRTHVVLRGPAERRLAEALGLAEEDLLTPADPGQGPDVPETHELAAIGRAAEEKLSSLAARLEKLDASLLGALDTTKRKIAYQLEQLAEKARKAAGRREDITAGRRKRLERMLLPGGVPAERVFPPLTPMLAYGDSAREALRRASGGSTQGAVVVDLGMTEGANTHAG
jgi:hypothetical protein